MQAPPSSPIHEWNCDDGHQDHDGPHPDGRVLSLRCFYAGTFEEIRRVVKDGNHSGQLKQVRNYYRLEKNRTNQTQANSLNPNYNRDINGEKTVIPSMINNAVDSLLRLIMILKSKETCTFTCC
jgi:hypothetical protein